MSVSMPSRQTASPRGYMPSTLTREDILRFHDPTYTGTVSVSGKTYCYGWCMHDNTLVAMHVIGGVTSTRAVMGQIYKGSGSIAVNLNDVSWNSKPASIRDRKFIKFESRIPDSNYLSMVFLSETLVRPNRDMHTIHLPFISEADLKSRLVHMIREIVYLPVMDEWADYLLEEGKIKQRVGPVSNAREYASHSSYWNSKGFDVYWLRTWAKDWEDIITNGLKHNRISIGE